MSLKLTYRITDLAPIPADTTVKGMELTYEDLDGNLRSIKVAIDALQSNLKFSALGGGLTPENVWDGSPQTISYNSVGAPSTTGANASGTWNINIEGVAGSVDWSNVLNKPANLGAYIDAESGLLVANGNVVDFANITGTVIGSQIADAALTTAKFASGIEPIKVVNTVPTEKISSIIFNTSDGKLYRWVVDTPGIPETDTTPAVPEVGHYTVSVATEDLIGTISAEQIAAYSIDPTKLSPGMEFIETVTELPTEKRGNMVFNNTDGKLYKWNGTEYVAAVNTTDLEGTLQNSQIEALAASKITGSLSDTQLSAISASKITGQIVNNQIADAALTTAKFATSIEPISIVSAVPTEKSTNNIFNTTDGKMYRWSGSEYVSSIAAADITGEIVASQIKNGALTTAKFATGIEPVTIVSSVPNTKSTSSVFNTADGKMYRWDGAAYVASVPTNDLTGQIVGTQITDNAISTEKIMANAIVTSKIAAGAVTADNIAANTITAGQIAAGAISANEIAANAINASKIAAGAVTADAIAANSIDAGKIAAGSITADNIGANAITAGKIAAGAVSAAEISAGAITTSKLFVSGRGNAINDDPMFTDSSAWEAASNISYVTNGALSTASNAQGSSYIRSSTGGSNGWATSRKYAVNPLKTYRLTANLYAANGNDRNMYIFVRLYRADGVTELTGADTGWGGSLAGYVYGGTPPTNQWSTQGGLFGFNTAYVIPSSAAYMQVGVWFQYSGNGTTSVEQACQNLYITEAVDNSLIVDGTIYGSKIVADSITSSQIAANAITASEIATNAITATHISAGAIEAGKIAAGAVSALEIMAGSITGDKIAANSITADNIAANAITAGQIMAGAITGDKIAANTIWANNIAANTLTSAHIAAASITGEVIAAGTIGTDHLIANSITTGKIQAGAIGADQIAAGAIRTDKLYVTGRGKALNDDPACMDNTAWSSSSGSYISTTDVGSPVGTNVIVTTGPTQFISRNFPVEGGKVYKVSAFVKKVSGTGTMYLRMYCFDASGNLVNYQVTPASGVGNYENVSVPGTWTRYAGTITASLGAVYAYVSIHSNWGGSGESRFTDIRAEEQIGADLIVDGTISANKIAVGGITADRIDTRGLTIKDVAGNTIFAAGTPLTSSYITPATEWVNTNITIDANGVLNGTGTNNVVVQNNKITVDSSGILTGIGTSSIVVDNTQVKVGGTNLLLNSGRFTDTSNWTSNGGTVTIDSTTTYGGYNTLKIAPPTGGAYSTATVRLKANTEYTISALVKGSAAIADGYDATLHIQNWTDEAPASVHQETAGNHDTAVTTSWKIIYQTFKTPSSATAVYCRFYFYPLGTVTLNVAYAKLEEGNKYTDWTPSPEEIKNKNITVNSSGVLVGTGTDNVVVNNSKITVDGSGVIQGIGTSNVTVDNTFTSIGQNLVANSDQATASRWVQGWNPYGVTFDYPLQYASNIWSSNYPLKGSTTRNLAIHQAGRYAGTDDDIAVDLYPLGAWDWTVNGIPVIAGQKYCASTYIVAHRCKASIGVQYWATDGTYLGESQSGVQTVASGNADSLNLYSRVYVTSTAPASAAYAMFYVRKHNTTAGNTESWFWVAAPQFEAVNANAGPSPYSAGPSANTRQLGYTGTLDANTTSVDSNGAIQGVSSGSGTVVSNSYVETQSFNTTGVSISGNVITKSSASSGWDSQAYSVSSFMNGAYCSFQVANASNYIMAGLNTDPSTDASYGSIDYALYMSGGTLYVYLNGSPKTDSNGNTVSYGAYAAGDILAVSYDGSNVYFYKNGSLLTSIYTSTPISYPLYFDSSFYTPGSQLKKVMFGPLTGSNWAQINGANKPADNANNTYVDGSGTIQGVSAGAGTAVQNTLISINSNGTLSGASTNGNAVTTSGLGLQLFRIVSKGGSASTGPSENGFYKNGTQLYGGNRSYTLVIVRRSDSAITFAQGYDVYGDANQAAALATKLNTIGPDSLVVLYAYDEPQGNRLTNSLPSAIYRCGGSPLVFTSSKFKYRSAYILIGIGNSGMGNGYEVYRGDVDSSADAWADVSFFIQNGSPVISGNSTKPTIDAGNVSTFISTAAITSAQIGSLDASVITAGTVQVGTTIKSSDNKFIVDFANKYISITI